MNELRLSINPIRPLPYYTVEGNADEKRLAAALRREFVPKVKRLLPGHHLGGFRHDTIVNFVKRHKRNYPCFVRTDITQFYPSVRHQDLVVGCQVAYRDLLNMEYVPKSFKMKYVGAVNAWCKSLPLHRGIPLASPLSAILAPAMLLPLWLSLKRQFGVPFLVYMDDVLVCTRDERQSGEIYAFIENYLHHHYALGLNRTKTVSGRFATATVSFCGWQFAGGYATVSADKVQAFRERVTELAMRTKRLGVRAFVKRMNRKIDAFGHYYKFGAVRGQFRSLDMLVRQEFRRWYTRTTGLKLRGVDAIAATGLRSLEQILPAVKSGNKPATGKPAIPAAGVQSSPRQPLPMADMQPLAETLDKIHTQLTQLLALQRKQLRVMQELLQM